MVVRWHTVPMSGSIPKLLQSLGYAADAVTAIVTKWI